MSALKQRLSVSALIATIEAMIEAGMIPEQQASFLRGIIEEVYSAFDDRSSPAVIIATEDPDFSEVEAAS